MCIPRNIPLQLGGYPRVDEFKRIYNHPRTISFFSVVVIRESMDLALANNI